MTFQLVFQPQSAPHQRPGSAELEPASQDVQCEGAAVPAVQVPDSQAGVPVVGPETTGSAPAAHVVIIGVGLGTVHSCV